MRAIFGRRGIKWSDAELPIERKNGTKAAGKCGLFCARAAVKATDWCLGFKRRSPGRSTKTAGDAAIYSPAGSGGAETETAPHVWNRPFSHQITFL